MEGISSVSYVESCIASKSKCLSKTQQHQVLSPHNNFPGKQPFSGIVGTNTLPLGSGSSTSRIFPIISRINYSSGCVGYLGTALRQNTKPFKMNKYMRMLRKNVWEYISVFESMNEWHKDLYSGGYLLLYTEYSYPPRSLNYL